MPLFARMIRSNLDRNPIIRSMDFTETFHQEDTNTLTVEEKQEAEQLQKDEQLRRKNPLAHNLLMAKRRHDQLQRVNAANSAGQGSREQYHSIHFTAPNPTMHGSVLIPRPAMYSPAQGSDLLRTAPPGTPQERGLHTSNAFPDSNSMPVGLSTRSDFAAKPSANDPVFEVHAQPTLVNTIQNVPDALTRVGPNEADVTATALAHHIVLQDNQNQPEKLKLKRKRTTESIANSVETSVPVQVDLSPILGASTTVRPLETYDDFEPGEPRSRRLGPKTPSPDSEPALKLTPAPGLSNLLNGEESKRSNLKIKSKSSG